MTKSRRCSFLEYIGRDLTPRAGCYLQADDWQGHGYILQDCPDWEKADFRYPAAAGQASAACNVRITARKGYVETDPYPYGGWWVRVKITWPGDGAPDTHAGGWLLVYHKLARPTETERKAKGLHPRITGISRLPFGYEA